MVILKKNLFIEICTCIMYKCGFCLGFFCVFLLFLGVFYVTCDSVI